MRISSCLVLLLGVGSSSLGAEPKAKPNVVLIINDDLGARDLSCTGSTYYKTPNLDAFAKQGVKLDEAYAPSIQDRGPLHPRSSFKLETPEINAVPAVKRSEVPAGYESISQLVWDEAAFRKRAKAAEGKPLFAVIMVTVQPTAEQIGKYKLGKPGSQGNPIHATTVEGVDRVFGEVVRMVDDILGPDNAIVVFSGGSGNSVEWKPNVPTTSNAPFREGNGYLYEGGLRVPFLIQGPGINVGGFPFVMDDLIPTLMGFCNAAPEPKSNGIDRSPQFRGEAKSDPNRAFYWHCPYYTPQFGKPGGAIRVGTMKLIEYFEDDRRELFDLAKDIGENRNLAAEKPEMVKELAAKLAGWRKEVGAKMPTPNREYAPNLQAKDGTITLHARTASVTGTQLRFEPAPHKNTLGYWTNKADTARFDLTVLTPGTFTVTVLQGAGKGSGGAEVELAVGDSKAKFTVKDTGGFQAFEKREVGELTIDKAGVHTLIVTPKSKLGVAVMDLREVTLTPKK